MSPRRRTWTTSALKLPAWAVSTSSSICCGSLDAVVVGVYPQSAELVGAGRAAGGQAHVVHEKVGGAAGGAEGELHRLARKFAHVKFAHEPGVRERFARDGQQRRLKRAAQIVDVRDWPNLRDWASLRGQTRPGSAWPSRPPAGRATAWVSAVVPVQGRRAARPASRRCVAGRRRAGRRGGPERRRLACQAD